MVALCSYFLKKTLQISTLDFANKKLNQNLNTKIIIQDFSGQRSRSKVELTGTWRNLPGIRGARLRGSWWRGAPDWRRPKDDGPQRRGASEAEGLALGRGEPGLATTPRCWGAQLPRRSGNQRLPAAEEMRKGFAESGASPAGSTHSRLLAVADLFPPARCRLPQMDSSILAPPA